MIALYRSDRQADALRVFTRTRTRAGRRAGPRSVAGAGRAADGDPQPRPAAARASRSAGVARRRRPTRRCPSRGPPTPEPPSHRHPTTSPVPLPGPAVRASATAFVGRQHAALGLLHDLWSVVVDGDRHLALLVGEAGAGKSRLAARFAADVARHGRHRAVGPGDAGGDRAVRADGRGLAHRAAHDVGRGRPRRGHRSWHPRRCCCPSSTTSCRGCASDRPDPSVERYLLFETVAELLHGESREHPLLIVLDDVQWADAPVAEDDRARASATS